MGNLIFGRGIGRKILVPLFYAPIFEYLGGR